MGAEVGGGGVLLVASEAAAHEGELFDEEVARLGLDFNKYGPWLCMEVTRVS